MFRTAIIVGKCRDIAVIAQCLEDIATHPLLFEKKQQLQKNG